MKTVFVLCTAFVEVTVVHFCLKRKTYVGVQASLRKQRHEIVYSETVLNEALHRARKTDTTEITKMMICVTQSMQRTGLLAGKSLHRAAYIS